MGNKNSFFKDGTKVKDLIGSNKTELKLGIAGIGEPGRITHLLNLDKCHIPEKPMGECITKIPEGIKLYVAPQLPILIPIVMGAQEK